MMNVTKNNCHQIFVFSLPAHSKSILGIAVSMACFWTLLAFSTNSLRPVNAQLQTEITSLLDRRLDAFRKADVRFLKNTSTPRHLKSIGPLSEQKRKLKSVQSRYMGAKLVKIRVFHFNQDEILAQYSIVDPTGKTIETMKDEWFVLVRKKGRYQVDNLINHFDPTDTTTR